jgi:hypothetical protein
MCSSQRKIRNRDVRHRKNLLYNNNINYYFIFKTIFSRHITVYYCTYHTRRCTTPVLLKCISLNAIYRFTRALLYIILCTGEWQYYACKILKSSNVVVAGGRCNVCAKCGMMWKMLLSDDRLNNNGYANYFRVMLIYLFIVSFNSMTYHVLNVWIYIILYCIIILRGYYCKYLIYI